MKKAVFLVNLVLLTAAFSAAQNTTDQNSSGILSSLPEIEIDSVQSNNSTGENTQSISKISWIIILGITFLGIVLYSFDLDPKWIILFLVVLGSLAVLESLNLIPV